MLSFLSVIEQKYIFGFPPFPDTASKTLGISWVMGSSFVIPNESLSTTPEFMLTRWVLVGPGVVSKEGLATPERPSTWLEGWNFQDSSPRHLQGKKRCWRLSGQSFNQSCLPNETPETQKNSEMMRLGAASWLVNIPLYQEDGAPQLHGGRGSYTQDLSTYTLCATSSDCSFVSLKTVVKYHAFCEFCESF